jgi:hypothetical protein
MQRYLSGVSSAAIVGAIVALLGLSACSPEYNWREVRIDAASARFMLPGKPASLDRTINIEGRPVVMTMTGAKVGESTYTVAYANIQAPADPQKTLVAMREQMVRNIQGSVQSQTGPTTQPMTQSQGQSFSAPLIKAVQVAIVDENGVAKASMTGQLVDAQGAVNGRPVSMKALFVTYQQTVVQAVSLGADLNQDQATQFVQSLRLIAKP